MISMNWLSETAKRIKDEDAKTILDHPEDFDKITVNNAIDRFKK